jgi:hypothetical protein
MFRVGKASATTLHVEPLILAFGFARERHRLSSPSARRNRQQAAPPEALLRF